MINQAVTLIDFKKTHQLYQAFGNPQTRVFGLSGVALVLVKVVCF
jgi:hypothetical protein